MEVRDIADAQHESAHVVVGVALGLRLLRASVGRVREGKYVLAGYAWFHSRGSDVRRREAWAMMYAAGIAWDRALGLPSVHSSLDLRELRKITSGRHGVETMVRAAGAMLAGLGPIHARVTRALLERDLSGSDLAAIARGEDLE